MFSRQHVYLFINVCIFLIQLFVVNDLFLLIYIYIYIFIYFLNIIIFYVHVY